jgi:hypothetical protein
LVVGDSYGKNSFDYLKRKSPKTYKVESDGVEAPAVALQANLAANGDWVLALALLAYSPRMSGSIEEKDCHKERIYE